MFLGNKKPVIARRVGKTLVATFRNSNPPLVWTFDLERNHSFTLALQGDEGDLELGVTSPKGEFYPIARFTAREDADLAFAAVQKNLMKRKQGWLGCLAKGAGALVLLLAVVLLIGGIMFHNWITGSVLNASAVGPSIKNGVLYPADQVLTPPH